MFYGDTYFADSEEIDATGTSLQGYIVTSREDLMKAFGAPLDYPLGDKVTTEWTIQFDNGEVATIYDWKRYEEGRPEFNELFQWNIGGHSRDVVSLVNDAVHRSQTNVIA